MTIVLDYHAIRNFCGWPAAFGRQGPLRVDIGCGKDDSLIDRALDRPDVNFVGIECDAGVAYRLEKKVRRQRAQNIRIVQFDARFALEHLFGPGSVQGFTMHFPDPWPKSRHARRRLLDQELAAVIRDKLENGGEFFIATDVRDMAESALKIIGETAGFLNVFGRNTSSFERPYPYPTLYEQKFVLQGLKIYYLLFRKASSAPISGDLCALHGKTGP